MDQLCGGKNEPERRKALRDYTEQPLRQRVTDSPSDRLVAGLLDIGAEPAFTIDAWVKPDSVAGAQPILEWNSGFVTGVAIWLSLESNVLHRLAA